MKRTLLVSPEAEAELQSAAIWYEERRPGLGIEFVAVVDRILEPILESWIVGARTRRRANRVQRCLAALSATPYGRTSSVPTF
jgi:hypothetical protein